MSRRYALFSGFLFVVGALAIFALHTVAVLHYIPEGPPAWTPLFFLYYGEAILTGAVIGQIAFVGINRIKHGGR